MKRNEKNKLAENGANPLDHEIHYTVFDDKFAKTMKRRKATLRRLAKAIQKQMAEEKDALKLVKLATFGDKRTTSGSLRHDANVLEVYGIEIDYDGGEMSPEEAIHSFECMGLSAVVMTSPSNMRPGKGHRWRAFLVFSRPMPPVERVKYVAIVNGVLGGVLGVESFTLSQAFFAGGVEGWHPVEVYFTDEGGFLDHSSDLEMMAISKPHSSTKAGGEVLFDETSAIAAIAAGADYHGAMMALLGKWAAKGVPMVEARAKIVAAFKAAPEKSRRPEWKSRVADIDRCLGWVYGKRVEDEVRVETQTLQLLKESDVDNPEPASPAAAKSGSDEEGVESLIDRMNDRYALTYLGGKAVVVDMGVDQLEFRTVQGFRDMNRNVFVGDVPLGSWWLDHPDRRTCDLGVAFYPGGDAPQGMINLFRGLAVTPDPEADCRLIIDYLREVVAGGDSDHADYIITWLADIVQNPGRKPRVALVLKGKKGVGKDTVAEIMRGIIGLAHTAHVTKTSRVSDRFNAQFAIALLIHLEEAAWGGDREAKGTLQSLITAPQMPLERKGIDIVQVPSYVRLLFTANERWVVPATADERRYAVFEVPSVRRYDTNYWNLLYAQIEDGGLSGFLHFLLTWEVPNGVDVGRPPNTQGLAEQKLAGLQNVQRWWYDRLFEGNLQTSFRADATDKDWEDSKKTVEKKLLRADYEEWHRKQKFQGELVDAATFGKDLKALCPSLEVTEPRDGGRRVKCYRLPSLQECRYGFEEAVGVPPDTIDWDTC